MATLLRAGYRGWWELEIFSDDGTYGTANGSGNGSGNGTGSESGNGTGNATGDDDVIEFGG